MTNTPLDKSNGNALMLDVSAIGGVTGTPAPSDDEIKALAAKHGATSFRRDQQRAGYMLDDVELVAFARALLGTSGVAPIDGGQPK
jgi:hypothetical protein